MKTIDEIIKQIEEDAFRNAEKAEIYGHLKGCETFAEWCNKEAEENNQIVNWLKELKEYRDKEHPPAEWIERQYFDGCDCWGKNEYMTAYICSYCKLIANRPTVYCPNCGSRMRGNEE